MNNMDYVAELQPGTTLCGGKYTIEKKIGAGGFGITYKAMQSDLGRAVCIKEYFPAGHCMRNTQAKTVQLQDMSEEMFEKYRLAFVREAQTLAQLRHPGVVEVIDIFSENNTSYMVLPFIEGQSLQSIIEQKGPLSYPEAVNYMAQVCNAVDYIHQRNILHRDIKPDNIMITPDYKAILIDFGSAREFEQDKTQAHTSILTHGYAPPEQYSAISRKGSYSDIYSMGATLYFLLTGQVPVDAAARLTEDLPEPKTFNPSIPDEANRTIMKAMQVKASDRHQTVQEFMDDLRNVKPSATAPDPVVEQKQKPETGRMQNKPASSKKTEPIQSIKTEPLPTQDLSDVKKTNNKTKIALIVAAAVLVLGSLLVFLLTSKGSSQDEMTDSANNLNGDYQEEVVNAEENPVEINTISTSYSNDSVVPVNEEVAEPEVISTEVLDVPKKYKLSVNNNIKNGSLKLSQKENVAAGTIITVTAEPFPNGHIESLYYKVNGKRVNIDMDEMQFEMPEGNTVVYAEFEIEKKEQVPAKTLHISKNYPTFTFYFNFISYKLRITNSDAIEDRLKDYREKGAKGINIIGYASPDEDYCDYEEGEGYGCGQELSENRALAMKKALEKNLDGLFVECTGEGVDWENLTYYVEHSNLSDKEAILKVIKECAKKDSEYKYKKIRMLMDTYPGFDAEVLKRMRRVDIYVLE